MRDQPAKAKQVVTTAVPPETLEAIKAKAKAENRSVSQTLCMLIVQAMGQSSPQPQTLAQANQISS